jgi:hypothetical protein
MFLEPYSNIKAVRTLVCSSTDRQLKKKPQWVLDLVKDAENDPELATLLMGTDGDPQAIRTKMRESLFPKFSDILGKNSGDFSVPIVTFRDLEDLSSLWVWVEFKDYPGDLTKENFDEAIKAFFIAGKLGGFNSLNLQVFFSGEAELSFFQYNLHDARDKMPSCFHELGDIEYDGRWARFFLDMGTTDELSPDILINMLIGFSKDITTLSQIILGGENSNWQRPYRQSRIQQLWSQIHETS